MLLLGENQLRTTVGIIEGKEVRFLAHVPMCSGDKCPLRQSCKFEPGGRCKLLYNFLRSLYESWVHPKNGLGDVLNQIQLDRIGTHLMPLYLQLARFSLDISALQETTFITKQGTVAAYPQFREIREVLREIRQEMKEMQLEEIWSNKFGAKRGVPGVDLDDLMKVGRTGAYEAMVERAKMKEAMAEIEEDRE